LTAPPQRPLPVPFNPSPECSQRFHVGRNSVVREVSAYHCPQSLPLRWDGQMLASTPVGLHRPQRGPHPLPHRLPDLQKRPLS